jgi:hypothetical protein
MRHSTVVLVAAIVVQALAPSLLHAEPTKCRLAVLKASAAYARSTLAARTRCEEARFKGKAVPCPDPAALEKAGVKLAATIAKACGGADKTCDAADVGADADDLPSAIGFPPTCPDYATRVCAAPITDCADVASCVRCVTDKAVEDTGDLGWGALLVPSADKAVTKCQRAVGRAGAVLFTTTSKALQRCWEAVAKGTATGPCPSPGDGKAAAALAKAEPQASAAPPASRSAPTAPTST